MNCRNALIFSGRYDMHHVIRNCCELYFCSVVDGVFNTCNSQPPPPQADMLFLVLAGQKVVNVLDQGIEDKVLDDKNIAAIV